MVVETKAFVPDLFYKKSRNKLRLSWAKLKLSYVEVKVEVVVKVGKEIVVEARVQLLVRQGWVGGRIKRN